jgi:hypothetical protein
LVWHPWPGLARGYLFGIDLIPGIDLIGCWDWVHGGGGGGMHLLKWCALLSVVDSVQKNNINLVVGRE